MSPTPRSVLITGGSRGLGAGLVESFLHELDKVATCSRSPSSLTRAWSEAFPDRFLYEALDITRRDEGTGFVKRVIDRFGGVDVLVNNAGVARDGVLGLLSEDDIGTMIDLNLKATLLMTRAVARRMLQQGSGRIINVSSVVGLAGYRGLSAYSATKAGLDGLTRSLARELGPRGITVNSVAPGYLRTEMSHGLDERQLDADRASHPGRPSRRAKRRCISGTVPCVT